MDIALQIMPSGLTFALRPDTSRIDDVMSMYVRWPKHRSSLAKLPTDLQQKILVQRQIEQMINRSAAESVLLSVVDRTAQHCIEGTMAALEKTDCTVFTRDAHADGAKGLMTDWLNGNDVDVGGRPLRPSRRRHST